METTAISLTPPHRNVSGTQRSGPAISRQGEPPGCSLGTLLRDAANQALGISMPSYAGRLHRGFNADWDAIADLHDLVECFMDEFAELKNAAAATRGVTTLEPARRRA